MLLDALSFRQHPILMDSISNTPAFSSGGERVENERYSSDDLELSTQGSDTSAEPDRARATIQMDPDAPCPNANYAYYKFELTYKDKKNQDQKETATVLVPRGDSPEGSKPSGTAKPAFQAGTEYWNVSSTFGTAWTTGTSRSLRISVSCGAWWTGHWSNDPTASYSTSFSKAATITSTNWKDMSTTSPPTSPPTTTMWNDSTGIDFDSSGNVTWYYKASNAPKSSYLVSPSPGTTVNFGTSAPASGTTYKLTQ